MLLVVLPFYSTFIKRAVLMFSPSLFLIWYFTMQIPLFTAFNMVSFCYGSFSFLESLSCSIQLLLHSVYCFLVFFPSIFAFLMAFFLGISAGTASWTVSNTVQLTARLIFRIFSDYFKWSTFRSVFFLQDPGCFLFHLSTWCFKYPWEGKRSSHSVQPEDSMHQLLSSSWVRIFWDFQSEEIEKVWWDVGRRRAGSGNKQPWLPGFPSSPVSPWPGQQTFWSMSHTLNWNTSQESSNSCLFSFFLIGSVDFVFFYDFCKYFY